MPTKVVNGNRRRMTRREEQDHVAAHPLRPPEPREPAVSEVLSEALKSNNVLTAAQIDEARQRLRQ